MNCSDYARGLNMPDHLTCSLGFADNSGSEYEKAVYCICESYKEYKLLSSYEHQSIFRTLSNI